MNDTSAAAATGGEIAPQHAFAWVFAGASTGPIAVPLEELTQTQWDRLAQRLPRETRRRMRIALEGLS